MAPSASQASTSGAVSTLDEIHRLIRSAPSSTASALESASTRVLRTVTSPDLLTVLHVEPSIDDLLRIGVFIQLISRKSRAKLGSGGKLNRTEPLGAVILVDNCTKGFLEVCQLLKTILGDEGAFVLGQAAMRWKNIFVVRSRAPTGSLMTSHGSYVWPVLGKVLRRMTMTGLLWHEHSSPEFLLELFARADLNAVTKAVLKGIVMTSAISFNEKGGSIKSGFHNAQLRTRLGAFVTDSHIPLVLADYYTLELRNRSTHALKDFVSTWPYLIPLFWQENMKTQIDQMVVAVVRLAAALQQKNGTSCVSLVHASFTEHHGRIWAKASVKLESYSPENCQLEKAKEALYNIYSISELPVDHWLDSLVGILFDANRDIDSLKAVPIMLADSILDHPTVKLTTQGSNVFIAISRDSKEVENNHHNWWRSYPRAMQTSKPPPKVERGPAEAWMDVVKGLTGIIDGILGHRDIVSWPDLEREYIRRSKQNLVNGPMTVLARRSLET